MRSDTTRRVEGGLGFPHNNFQVARIEGKTKIVMGRIGDQAQTIHQNPGGSTSLNPGNPGVERRMRTNGSFFSMQKGNHDQLNHQ